MFVMSSEVIPLSNFISSKSKGKTILIVEDNDLNLKLFRDLLGANGYDTIETKEGLEAVEITKSMRPDLILMDIQLPEISGLEVTRRIKADREICAIPIIAVTAFAMKNDEEKILRAGCEAYISKPISIMDFLSTVRYFLGELQEEQGIKELA
jgi:two-component system cell cycle response regulator DivK